MEIKKGDYVEVIDEPMSGKVLKVNGEKVTIISEDDFELEFDACDLVVVKGYYEVRNHEVKSVLSDKELPKRKKPIVTSKKERFQPKMEVDLHIHQLVTNFKGLTKHDMLTLQLETAERQLKFAIEKRIQKMVFIHGVGEGVLRSELEYLFGRYDNVSFYDADYSKYGLGATEVYIHQNS